MTRKNTKEKSASTPEITQGDNYTQLVKAIEAVNRAFIPSEEFRQISASVMRKS